MAKDKLDHMFNPSTVAVVGASQSPKKWGGSILSHIIQGGYKGEVYPVNLKEEEIQGLKTYPSVLEIPEAVDLSIIATPSRTVPPIIEDCVDGDVETAVIISSGFGETGEDEKKVEKEMASMAREEGLRFAGPNCMGIFSAEADLIALMPSIEPLPGNVSIVSQSGNLGIQMLHRGSLMGIGFDLFVGSGNEADLKCEDYINYFRKRSTTEITLAYIEGINDGRKFLEVSRNTTEKKPIVAYKAGETEAGKKAAKSHTGSLTGSRKIYDGVFKQAGITKAETTQNMLNYATAFEQPPPKNDEIVIVTRGGGWGVVAADNCGKYGIKTPPPPDNMLKDLDKILPPYWSRGNPIDLVAVRDPSVQIKILDLVGKWDVGGILILGGIGKHFIKSMMGDSEEVAKTVAIDYVKRIIELNDEKTIFTVALEPQDDSEPVRLLREKDIPVYFDPETAVKSYSKLVEYRKYLKMRENGKLR